MTMTMTMLMQIGPGLWPTLEHVALIVAITGGIAGILVARRKHLTNRIEPQPLEIDGDIRVTPKGRRWSSDICDEKHTTITRRLQVHDDQIGELWRTMRTEDAATRESLSKAVRDFDRTVGELHGTLMKVDQTMQMILKRELDQ